MKGPFAVGSDIGGSHISCALVDMRSHEILEKSYTKLEVDNKGSASEITSSWCRAITECLQKAEVSQPAGIGLAMPGPFDYVNGIGLFEGVDKFDNLNGIDVEAAIRSGLDLRHEASIRFINDATSFAVGAVWSDDTLAEQHVLAITLGTGFGSAFIMDSLPVLDDPRVPAMGCVYHLPFREGIADDTFSTRGMIRSYHERSGITVRGVKDIADRAGSEADARVTFQAFGSELASFLSPWIHSAGISRIIMGGNITKAYALFSKEFESELKLTGLQVSVHITPGTDRMAILGSARLSDESYWERISPLLKYM